MKNREFFYYLQQTAGETHCLAAARKTIEILRDGEIIKNNWKMGQQLIEDFNKIAAEFSVSGFVKMTGVPCSPYQLFLKNDKTVDLALSHTIFARNDKAGSVNSLHFYLLCSLHLWMLKKTLEASRNSMKVLQIAIEKGTTDGLLVGPAVKPVFRKFN